MAAPAADRPHRHTRPLEWATDVHVYEPHTGGIPPIGDYLREVWRRREFAFELSRTQLRAQQYRTLLGQLWLVLNPVLLGLVYFILVDIIRSGGGQPDRLVHLLGGVFGYHLASTAIREGATSLTRSGRLILNSSFPRMLLPLSAVLSALKQFLPCVPLYIVLHWGFGRPVDADTLWVLLLTTMLLVVGTGLALFAATVQIYFRDLKSILPYALRIMLFGAPILYFASDVPERYQWVVDVNPLGQMMTAWEQVLFFAEAPSAHSLIISGAWAFGSLVVGGLLFMSREREFAARI